MIAETKGSESPWKDKTFTTVLSSLVLDVFAFQEVLFHGAQKLPLPPSNFVPECCECAVALRCHYMIVVLWELCGGVV